MSYRLINSNEIAIKYPEVNDMPCIYADLPNGLNGDFYDLSVYPKILEKMEQPTVCDIDAIRVIKGMPSVTQKSGKWILLDECANSGYYCSNCQKKLVKEGWSETVKKIKFCPNCGAKMLEPQESEEKK